MPHLLAGLILAGLGIWGIVTWWEVFGLVMRGVVPFCLLMLGLIAILAGYRKKAQGAPVVAASREGSPPPTA